jgi:hypothetical protein
VSDRAEWLRIEDEAREAASVANEPTPPVGSLVAWAECRFARTDGFSAVHRVGEVVSDAAYTLCGEVVPDPTRRINPTILTPRLVQMLGKCRFCENRYAEKAA